MGEATDVTATQQMLRLAEQISRATADADWRRLAALDREVARLLTRIARRPAQSGEHRAALEALRRAHDRARERCAGEIERASVRLAELRERRKGWIAYAMNDDEAWNDIVRDDPLRIGEGA
jgi:hypothetical protein